MPEERARLESTLRRCAFFALYLVCSAAAYEARWLPTQPPHTFAVTTLLFEPMLTSGCLGIALMYLSVTTAPRWRTLGLVGLGFLLELLLLRYRLPLRPPLMCLLLLGTGFGAAGCLGFLADFVATRRWQVLGLGLLAVISPAASLLGGSYLLLISRWTPQTCDAYAYCLDLTMGTAIPFVVADFIYRHAVPYLLCFGTYTQLNLILSLVLILYVRKPLHAYFDPFLAIALVGFIGTALYPVFPLAGPGALFPEGYPMQRPFPVVAHPDWVSIPEHFWRNGMPSLHTAWILVAYCGLRPYGRGWRMFGALAVALTLPSIFLAPHFAIDLVVGFPLVLLCQSLAAFPAPGNRGARWMGILFGALGSLGTIAMLRLAPDCAIAVGALMPSLTLMLGSVVLERHLCRQSKEGLNLSNL